MEIYREKSFPFTELDMQLLSILTVLKMCNATIVIINKITIIFAG